MTLSERMLLSLLFFVSGFASLVYQVVWTRLAFASFGIITPVLSVVISVFMLGLALGSWAGGKWIDPLVKRSGLPAIHFYALAEFFIGLGAFGVPFLFRSGENLLLGAGQSDSTTYLFLSALVLAGSILPWCVCMGVTFPWMMAHIRTRPFASRESFSFLYVANVLGAVCGTLITGLALIELFGFHDTLRVAASGNFLITGISFWLGRRRSAPQSAGSSAALPPTHNAPRLTPARSRLVKWLLFTTGFCSVAMEVVWTRAFCPVLKTQVYSFALILAAYLGATVIGSLLYRSHLKNRTCRSTSELLLLLALSALLPVIANDTRFVHANPGFVLHPLSALILLASICPFCALLGYLTPGLVDEFASGSPAEAGFSYALNVLGCIVGPLIASYLLLPNIDERHALILLALPFFLFAFWSGDKLLVKRRWTLGFALLAFLFASLFLSRDYEDTVRRTNPEAQVRRDYAASVLSFGYDRDKSLVVNGVGMTKLTPVTKFMVHLPAAFHAGPTKSALIICFGMGTSYRSALSWDVPTTAVELVPSVKDALGFYHTNAAQCLTNPQGRIIIDDGRRFLKRTRDQFDIIVVDPPPPQEAAGSSLLYSDEFYQLAKQRLKPGGILQAWILADATVVPAALRSVKESFPYVRCFLALNSWGVHVLASMQPIQITTGDELASRMSTPVQTDLLEWTSIRNPAVYLNLVLTNEIPVQNLLAPNPQIRITDDLPYNEYFLLRRLGL